MISEDNYKRMATEVLEIINLYPEKIKEKIPAKLISEFEKNRLPDLKVQLNKDKKLYEQDLCDETLVMVYMLYRNYIAEPEEKSHFDNILNKFDEETRKKYDPANLFKNNRSEINNQDNTHQDR